MKMLKSFFLLFVLICSGLLSSCDLDDNDLGSLPTDSVGNAIEIDLEGFEDFSVKPKKSQIILEVESSVDEIDSDILKIEGATKITISQRENEKLEELRIDYGENIFDVIFTIGSKEFDWKLIVNRELEDDDSNDETENEDDDSNDETENEDDDSNDEIENEDDVITNVILLEFQRTYYRGDKFVEGVLQIQRDDKFENVIITEDMVEGFDTSVATGAKKVIIHYNDYSIWTNIKVCEDKIDYINFIDFKETYYLNEKFNGGIIEVHYLRGVTKVVNIDESMIKGFDTSKTGKYRVTIIYEGLSVEKLIDVVLNAPKTIKLLDFKLNYLVGEKFNDGTVLVTRDDGSNEVINVTSMMISNFNTNNPGTFEINIIIDGVKFVEKINVISNDIKNVNINSYENPYYVGDEFKGATLLVKYMDGSERIINVEKEMVKSLDTSSAGEGSLIISYSGFEVCAKIIVLEKSNIKMIEINSFPRKVLEHEKYFEASLLVTYIDGTTEIVNVTKDMVEGFDTEQRGIRDAKITYKGISIVVSYEVIVAYGILDSIVLDMETDYLIGDEFKGGKVLFILSNDTNIIHNLTKNDIMPIDTSKVGDIGIYLKKNTYYMITTIHVDKVEKLEVVSLNHNYLVNSNLENGVLKVTYASGKVENILITPDMVEGFNSSNVGVHNISINYKGSSVSEKITVYNSGDILSHRIINMDRSYQINEEFKPGLVEFKLFSGEIETRTITLDMLKGFSTASEGEFNVEATYNDYKFEFTIKVDNPIVDIDILNFKTEYEINTNYVPAKFDIIRYDGTKEYVDITLDMIEGFDTSTMGVKRLTIRYDRYVFMVDMMVVSSIREIEAFSFEKNYYLNEEFKGGRLKITYLDGNDKIVDITLDMIKGFDTTSTGKHIIKISYEDASINVEIMVSDKPNSNISIDRLKQTYYIGEAFEEGELSYTRSDGQVETAVITRSMLDDFTTNTLGDYLTYLRFNGEAIEVRFEVLPTNKLGLQKVYIDHNGTAYDAINNDEFMRISELSKDEKINLYKDLFNGIKFRFLYYDKPTVETKNVFDYLAKENLSYRLDFLEHEEFFELSLNIGGNSNSIYIANSDLFISSFEIYQMWDLDHDIIYDASKPLNNEIIKNEVVGSTILFGKFFNDNTICYLRGKAFKSFLDKFMQSYEISKENISGYGSPSKRVILHFTNGFVHTVDTVGISSTADVTFKAIGFDDIIYTKTSITKEEIDKLIANEIVSLGYTDGELTANLYNYTYSFTQNYSNNKINLNFVISLFGVDYHVNTSLEVMTKDMMHIACIYLNPGLDCLIVDDFNNIKIEDIYDFLTIRIWSNFGTTHKSLIDEGYLFTSFNYRIENNKLYGEVDLNGDCEHFELPIYEKKYLGKIREFEVNGHGDHGYDDGSDIQIDFRGSNIEKYKYEVIDKALDIRVNYVSYNYLGYDYIHASLFASSVIVKDNTIEVTLDLYGDIRLYRIHLNIIS